MNPNKRYWHDIIGFNYRMTNLQAAIGVAQLKKIDEFIKIKRRNAELYNKFLKNIPGLILPPEMPWAKNVYWMYSLLLSKDLNLDQVEFRQKLKEKGIDTRSFFYPVHSMPPYKRKNIDIDLPVSNKLSKQGINLPSSVKLKSEEINFICNIIKIATNEARS
jgi:perosamine synthetase